MSRKRVIAILALFSILGFGQTADRAWREDLLKWRTAHAADLQKPENWLSLIGLEWLKEGDNRLGSGKANDIQINAKVPAQVAIFRLAKGKVTLIAPAGGFGKELPVEGKPAKEQELRADDQPPRSKVSLGTVSLIVLHRGERYALRIWDSTAPTRTNFKGLHWYEPDAKYLIQARWIPY